MSGKVGFIVGLVFLVVFIGFIASGIGLGAAPEYVMERPDDLSTWGYIWNGLVFFVDMLTFQVPGVPVAVNMLVIFPFMAGLLYIIIRVARG